MSSRFLTFIAGGRKSGYLYAVLNIIISLVLEANAIISLTATVWFCV